MNYYPHHIGDYAKDTAHLTMIEDGAYRRLLDLLYSTERPLPKDRERLYRLARARSAGEKAAVDSVLVEFFTDGPEGWTQSRASEEITKAQEKSGKAKESAAMRWESERKANAHANAHADAMRTHSEGNAPNNQEPIANSQRKEVVGAKAPTRPPDDSPVIETLPLRTGDVYEVRQSLVAQLEPIYPKVDIPATVREMKGWLLTNAERRKTRKGTPAFINRWLKTEQEKADGAQAR